MKDFFLVLGNVAYLVIVSLVSAFISLTIITWIEAKERGHDDR